MLCHVTACDDTATLVDMYSWTLQDETGSDHDECEEDGRGSSESQ